MSSRRSDPRSGRSGAARSGLVVVFVLLLGGLAAGIWGTVLRPPAYEVKGEVVARAAPNLLIVRHEAVSALGMAAMETMAVEGEPALLDRAGVAPGDRVQLAVRRSGERIVAVWVRKVD